MKRSVILATYLPLVLLSPLIGWALNIALVANARFAESGSNATQTASLMLLGGVAIMALAYLGHRLRDGIIRGLALQLVAVVPLTVLLRGTGTYLFGVNGDQQFRLALVEKYTYFFTPVDAYDAQAPGFYPGLWFWLSGKLMRVVGWSAPRGYTVVALATLAATTAIVCWLWEECRRKQLTAVPTAVAGLAASLAGWFFAAYEPYSWIVLAPIVPVSYLFLDALRSLGTTPVRGLAVTGAWLGLYLGLAASTYSLVAVPVGLVTLILLAVARPRAGLKKWAALFVPAILVAGVLAAYWWAGYLLHRSEGGAGNVAASYAPAESVAFAFPEDPLWAALCLIAVASVAVQWHALRALEAHVVVLGGCVAWYALSAVRNVAVGGSLLAFRSTPLVMMIVVLLAWELFTLVVQALASARLRAGAQERAIRVSRHRPLPPVGALACGVALIVAAQHPTAELSSYAQEAQKARTQVDALVELGTCVRNGLGEKIDGASLVAYELNLPAVLPVFTQAPPNITYVNPTTNLTSHERLIAALSGAHTTEELKQILADYRLDGLAALERDGRLVVRALDTQGRIVETAIDPAAVSNEWESVTCGETRVILTAGS